MNATARRVVTTGLVLAMAVVALEVTVVTTALPTIVGEFDRLDLYPWVFSSYLLTSTVTTPLYGKLADLYGRRRIFIIGIAFFLIGSVLSGLATSMGQLIAFRALQGLGAGAMMPTIFTAIADLYRLEERARVQGLFSALWGVASLLGPSLGAWLTLTWSWRGVFFVGVPFGVVAAVLLWSFFKEEVERRSVKLDLAGSALLTAGLVVLLVTMTQGGTTLAWTSPEILGLAAVTVALLVGFIVVEGRAEDPVLPLSLFKQPVMSVSAAGNFLSGAVLFGVTSYAPLYVQGVGGEDAAAAGAVLTPMLLAWAVSGYFGPRLLLRFGLRQTAIGATSLIALGAAGLVLMAPGTPRLLLMVSVTVMGIGFGPSIAAFIMAVQESVPWQVRGVATSVTQLSRMLGGTIGVALLGTVLQVGLTARLGASSLEWEASRALLNPAARDRLPSDQVEVLQLALGAALQPVFVATLVLAVATVLMVVVFARGEGMLLRQDAPGTVRREARGIAQERVPGQAL